MTWTPGETILWREVWRGRTWLVHPVRVVRDEPRLLALYLAEGTPLVSPPGSWPFAGGTHPWAAVGRFRGAGPLILHRPGDPYTVWALYRGAGRTFSGWYVNFQRPLARTADGVETLDHELDIEVDLDGGWRWKDADAVEHWVEAGRMTRAEADAVLADGRRVAAMLDRGERWWGDEWLAWRPDPSWKTPALPPGLGSGP